MRLDPVILGLTLLGMRVWIGRGSQCFFVVVIDELARAKTWKEKLEAEVVKRSIVEAIAFAVEFVVASVVVVAVAFGTKVVRCVAEVLFIIEILAFDPIVPP